MFDRKYLFIYVAAIVVIIPVIFALLCCTENEQQKKEVSKLEKILTNSLGMKFVYIPPGTFMMGSPSKESGRENGETQHEVTLTNGYYMGVTEVTQGQWKAIMKNNPSRFNDCGDDCPVETVGWSEVKEFIRLLNLKEGTDKYRIPTEAEWEYACRAGSTTIYSYGNDKSILGEYAWYTKNSEGKTHPVAMKKPNPWGLYDMHGNVAEWVKDWYLEYSSAYVTDPTGPSSESLNSQRVFRGGGWHEDATKCRSACRDRVIPIVKGDLIGFRLARNL